MERSLFIYSFAALLLILSTATAAESEKKSSPHKIAKSTTDAIVSTTPSVGCTKENCSQGSDNNKNGSNTEENNFFNKITTKIKENKSMLLRTLYVVIGVTGVVIIFFLFRSWRTRRRKNRTKKYGLITSRGTDLEMAPLDQDSDEDEDMTVFELNNGKLK